MTATRDDVVAKAVALFGEDRAVQALALIDEYGTKSYEREVDRVKRAHD